MSSAPRFRPREAGNLGKTREPLHQRSSKENRIRELARVEAAQKIIDGNATFGAPGLQPLFGVGAF